MTDGTHDTTEANRPREGTDTTRPVGLGGGRRMADFDHAHPHDDRGVGRTFRRGPTIVTDGGETEADDERATMADVDHTPPNDAPDVTRVFERGEDGADEADE